MMENETGGPKPSVEEQKPSSSEMNHAPSESSDFNGDDSDWELSFDPRALDYAQDVGLHDPDDAGMTIIGRRLYNETRTKDTPCRFHDGKSGRCWKGASCPYGHELRTGGLYDKEHPNIALAVANQRSVTYCNRLPTKSVLEKEAEISCKITHVDDPSRFYIRPSGNVNGSCNCTKIQAMVPKMNMEEGPAIDDYYFGVYGFEAEADAPECTLEVEKGEPELKWKNAKTIDAKVHQFLQTGLNYKKYQESFYEPHAELVAVRINQRWCRSIVLRSSNLNVLRENEAPMVTRVQVLETGAKLSVGQKDICKLPEKFCSIPTGAFKCSLFGISPVWGVWSSGCTKLFNDLIKDRETKIIVKIVPKCNRIENIQLFESRPYSVKVMFAQGKKWIDVAEEMNQAGHGLPWNPFPKRPFATRVIETKGRDFVYKQGHKVPASALKLENRRLTYLDDDDDCDDYDSDSGTYVATEHHFA